MKLSQDIIYYRLSREFSVRYIKRNEADVTLKRPIFYENEANISNCAVIISAEDLKIFIDKRISFSDTLFICTGKPPKSAKAPECSVIAFEAKVSPVGIFNYLQEVYNLFDNWDEALKNVCYEGGSFGDLIDCCDPVISDPVILVDKEFHYVAYSKEMSEERGIDAFMDENNNIPVDDVNDFIANSEFQELYDIREVFGYSSAYSSSAVEDMVCRNIFYRNDYVGRLVITLIDIDEHVMKYNIALLKHLIVYVDKLFGKYISFNPKEIVLNSLRSLLLDGLDKKEISDGQWEKALEENGWNQSDKLQLVQFKPNTSYNINMYAKYLGTEIESKWKGCACFEYNDRLLLLVNHDKFGAPAKMTFNQSLAYFLRESLLVAGRSRVFSDMKLLCSAYEQTDIALDFGGRETPTLWFYKFDDYVLSYMLSSCTGSFAKEQICSEKLLALKQYDAEKKTEYYKTLLVYFKCRLNAAASAKKLFIHRSTFLNRMDRILEIMGIDFDSNDQLLYLALSFQILERNSL